MKKYKLVIWMIPVVVILYLVISFFDFNTIIMALLWKI